MLFLAEHIIPCHFLMEKLSLLPFRCFNVWISETRQLYSRRRWIHGFGHYCGNLPPDNSSGHWNDCRISADFVNKDTFKSVAGTVARDLLDNATQRGTTREQQGGLCFAKTPVPSLLHPSYTILTIRNLLVHAKQGATHPTDPGTCCFGNYFWQQLDRWQLKNCSDPRAV